MPPVPAGRAFGEPEGAPPLSVTQVRPPEQRWTVSRDLVGYNSALEIVKDGGTVRHDAIGLEVGRRAFERYDSVADDFTSVRGESTWTMRFSRGDWDVRTVTSTVLRSTETEFQLHATLDGCEGERRVFSRNWQESFPRDQLQGPARPVSSRRPARSPRNRR